MQHTSNPHARRCSAKRPVAIAVALAALAAFTSSSSVAVADSPAECVAPFPGTPMSVTADCVDPLYAAPVIDSETDETSPSPHRRVSGHFEGTDVEFNIYLPPADRFEGRFIQWTYPTAFAPGENTAVATERALGFAFSQGGYAVQAGSAFPVNALGYRHVAAAAKFAERVAASYYGVATPIYGYLYGGSGGSYQTIGAAENTVGVWDGFVPYIIGTPMSTPYNFFIRSLAGVVLGDKAEEIREAVSPGGGGDPFAGLDDAEVAMLTELTQFGIPLQAWENPDYVLGRPPYFPDGLLGFGVIIKLVDGSYVDDFWNSAGYLGTETSALGDAVRAALADAGSSPADCIGGASAPAACWDLALGAYHRHQLPPADAGYIGFDQFRAADGTPMYPQRPLVWGPLLTGGVSGNTPYDGHINAKMIVVDNLYDSDALATPADWYARRVEAALGSEAFATSFRVYFNDHADHQEAPVSGQRATYLVTFWGMVEQAVGDTIAWVEHGVEPPASTQYEIEGGQVVVPQRASSRLGIQPTVDLTVRNADSVTVRAGRKVEFQAVVRTPPDTGVVVGIAWDFEGDGTYVDQRVNGRRDRVRVSTSHRFDTPGVYYVAVRVTTQRDGVDSPYTQVQNLDRVRVVVEGAHGCHGRRCGPPDRQ